MFSILDIHPGYLGNKALFRESSTLASILSGVAADGDPELNKYELVRWQEYKWAASRRYLWLIAELKFRKLPREPLGNKAKEENNFNHWPESNIAPSQQIQTISKSPDAEQTARIPVPDNAQQLWAQHKYSVMARDVNYYRDLGPRVARMTTGLEYSNLVDELTYTLRNQPGEGGLRNALLHMWGHVSTGSPASPDFEEWTLAKLLEQIVLRVEEQDEKYLLHSTALTEIDTWINV